VWYVREQRPTQFAREVGKAMKTSGEIAGTAAVVGLAVGVTALDAWAESQADDCATDGYHERNRHHHRNTEHQSPTTRPVRK
jgi:hypothetical protein